MNCLLTWRIKNGVLSVLIAMFMVVASMQAALYEQMRGMVDHMADTTWTVVVGAGPAGIAVIGLLLDSGVDAKKIIWVDSAFAVGRLGQHYYNVPGNTIAEHYISFVNDCMTFGEYSSPALDYLRNYYPYECCTLQVVIDALQDITNYLKTRVICYTDTMSALAFKQDNWVVSLKSGYSFLSHNVILATGSHPKVLDYACSATNIPLDDALDKQKLMKCIEPEDTIAVVGGAHSAMLAIKYLYELGAKRIINFYLQPITYGYDMGEGNIPDYNGLKGDVAEWVFDVLEKEKPETIIRVKNTKESRDTWLPLCNKIIYAIGFARNEIPLMESNGAALIDNYNPITGEIAPRLFGIGIAFPEKIVDPWGKQQYTVGIIDFLTYAQRVVPSWIKKRRSLDCFYAYQHLFDIQIIQ